MLTFILLMLFYSRNCFIRVSRNDVHRSYFLYLHGLFIDMSIQSVDENHEFFFICCMEIYTFVRNISFYIKV